MEIDFLKPGSVKSWCILSFHQVLNYGSCYSYYSNMHCSYYNAYNFFKENSIA